jgi:Prokaryotic N-terminal methylation motif
MHNCKDEQQPMKKETKYSRFIQSTRGFSLLEVLLGISVFMIGMLGVTALNISSMKSNTFSGNLSEATVVAASKLEELMAQDFDDPASQLFDEDNDGNCHDIPAIHTCDPSPFVNQDADDDGIDDDLAASGTHDDDTNFGLDDFGADADYSDTVVKNNITYNIYWNVAENEPISIDPDVSNATQRTKLINVIVEWLVKDEPRRISMSTIRQKE